MTVYFPDGTGILKDRQAETLKLRDYKQYPERCTHDDDWLKVQRGYDNSVWQLHCSVCKTRWLCGKLR